MPHGLKLLEKPAGAPRYREQRGELWNADEQHMHSLHNAAAYRGSFKPALPDFCIRRYSSKGEIVFDPFCGRGTTALQSNLLGRVAWASDINPLAIFITQAKSVPVGLDEVVLRLNQVDFTRPVALNDYRDLFFPFYHAQTFRELLNFRSFLHKNRDRVNVFLELLALSRLHGHTQGYFSAYSFPQIAISPAKQQLLNLKRREEPDYRAVPPRIIKKAAEVVRDGFSGDFYEAASRNILKLSDARFCTWVPASSVNLIVTAPPLFDDVDYVGEYWLEYWFSGLNPAHYRSRALKATSFDVWRQFMRAVFQEFLRVLKPDRYAVIPAGMIETKNALIDLDDIYTAELSDLMYEGRRLRVEEVLVNQENYNRTYEVERGPATVARTNRLLVLRSVHPSRRRTRRV